MKFSCLKLALFATVVASSLSAQEPIPGLDAYVTKAMAGWKVPGLAIAIVRNDSVLYAKGYGTQRVGTTTPVDDRTLFEIGSSSKSFTATLVAMMVTDGKMKFDGLVSSYIPDFRLYDPVASAELTIRDALTHRSGLSRGELAWMASGATREQVLHRVRFLKPTYSFRSRWQYQNIMFLAAGEAAAKAAGPGNKWEDLIQQRIFTPLGMTSSIPVVRDATGIQNFAIGHGTTKDSVWAMPNHMNIDDAAPAGSIVSSARDMAQYLRFQLGDGSFGGKRLVGAGPFRETHSPQMLIGSGSEIPVDSVTTFNTYGMGWFVQDYRGTLMVQHGGNTDGMTTAMGVLPQQKFGVVVLSNMAGSPLPDLLMKWIFERQLKSPMRDLSGEQLTRIAGMRRRADSVAKVQQAGLPAPGAAPLPLEAYTGTYADSLYGEGTVTLENGKLIFARGEWKAPLEHVGYGNFRWGTLPSAVLQQMPVKFDVTADGKVSGLSLSLGADVIPMAKRQAPREGGRGGNR